MRPDLCSQDPIIVYFSFYFPSVVWPVPYLTFPSLHQVYYGNIHSLDTENKTSTTPPPPHCRLRVYNTRVYHEDLDIRGLGLGRPGLGH